MLGARPDTITLKEAEAKSPAPSVAVCVTTVVPIGKVAPSAKPAVNAVITVQLSVATGVV